MKKITYLLMFILVVSFMSCNDTTIEEHKVAIEQEITVLKEDKNVFLNVQSSYEISLLDSIERLSTPYDEEDIQGLFLEMDEMGKEYSYPIIHAVNDSIITLINPFGWDAK